MSEAGIWGDDKVWSRSIARGTHLGEWMGMPATGAAFEIEVVDICRIESGKVVEHRGSPTASPNWFNWAC